MRLRSLAAPSLLLLSSALIAPGCGRSSPGSGETGNPDKASATGGVSADNPNPDVGPYLFQPAAEPKPPEAMNQSRVDPIVIGNATVQYEERQRVAAEVDGTIELIAKELPAGTVYDPNNSLHVLSPRDKGEKKPYRRLADGDEVNKGDVICIMNDEQISTRKRAAERTKAAAEQVQKSAQKGVDLTNEKLKITVDLYKKGGISYTEVLNDYVTLSRFEENLANSIQTIAKAQSDFEEAEVLMKKHRIVSSVNGVIRNVVKRPGEFVKAGESILEVQSTERVRLEGNLDVQYANKVLRNMQVTVEPALASAPVKSHAWHRQEVTGIAVTPHPDRAIVISTSADGSALVWEPNLNDVEGRPTAAHTLLHPVAVRSIACGPHIQNGSALVVTGADDGRIRLWDVNPAKLPTSPRVTATDAHTSAVVAVAFSPDGRFIASAAGREVFIWSAADGKKLYALPAEHRDTITSVQFTPQSRLITASKDRTVKQWKLGAGAAAVTKTIDHRSGAIDVLGVSKDGGRVLFDQDKARIDVVNLADKQTVGQIQTPGSTAAFATLAMFSQNEEYILTAGGEGELKGALQLWTTPSTGGRGAEAGRLITPGRIGVTCAAFSPSKESPFLVVGTAAGTVHLWTPPAGPPKKHIGTVMNVDSTDPRYVTVRVEMDNKELKLLDRSAATIIVNPGK